MADLMHVIAKSSADTSESAPTFLISVPSFTDIDDDAALRGYYTVYDICCTVQALDGTLWTFAANRRYSEWRDLHAQQWNGLRKFPQARHFLHGPSTKLKRQEALQAWLADAFAAYAGTMPPPQLLHFVGVRAEALAGMAPSPSLSDSNPLMQGLSGGADLDATAQSAYSSCVSLPPVAPLCSNSDVSSRAGGGSGLASGSSSRGGGVILAAGGSRARTPSPVQFADSGRDHFPCASESSGASLPAGAAPAVSLPAGAAPAPAGATPSGAAAAAAHERVRVGFAGRAAGATTRWVVEARRAFEVFAARAEASGRAATHRLFPSTSAPPVLALAAAVLWLMTNADLLCLVLISEHAIRAPPPLDVAALPPPLASIAASAVEAAAAPPLLVLPVVLYAMERCHRLIATAPTMNAAEAARAAAPLGSSAHVLWWGSALASCAHGQPLVMPLGLIAAVRLIGALVNSLAATTATGAAAPTIFGRRWLAWAATAQHAAAAIACALLPLQQIIWPLLPPAVEVAAAAAAKAAAEVATAAAEAATAAAEAATKVVAGAAVVSEAALSSPSEEAACATATCATVTPVHDALMASVALPIASAAAAAPAAAASSAAAAAMASVQGASAWLSRMESLGAWLVLATLLKQLAESSELARWARLGASLTRQAAAEAEQRKVQARDAPVVAKDAPGAAGAARAARAAAKARRREARERMRHEAPPSATAAHHAPSSTEASEGWALVDDGATEERGFKHDRPNKTRASATWRRRAAAAPPGAFFADHGHSPPTLPADTHLTTPSSSQPSSTGLLPLPHIDQSSFTLPVAVATPSAARGRCGTHPATVPSASHADGFLQRIPSRDLYSPYRTYPPPPVAAGISTSACAAVAESSLDSPSPSSSDDDDDDDDGDDATTDADLSRLVEMGFSEELAEAALAANGTVEAAAASLMDEGAAYARMQHASPICTSSSGGPAHASPAAGPIDGVASPPASAAPSAIASELESVTEQVLACLPHELRVLTQPMVAELFHGRASAAATKGLVQLRGLIQAIGAAVSLVLTRALLDPAGRMRLWLGLKALADSEPMQGKLPAVFEAFTKQRHAFELGMQGSLVLSEAFKVETRVPMARLYKPKVGVAYALNSP